MKIEAIGEMNSIHFNEGVNLETNFQLFYINFIEIMIFVSINMTWEDINFITFVSSLLSLVT